MTVIHNFLIDLAKLSEGLIDCTLFCILYLLKLYIFEFVNYFQTSVHFQ